MKQATIGLLLIASATLTACSDSMTQTSANIMGMQSIAGVQRASNTEPSSADLAMSCGQINSELSSLYAEIETINKAERARERKANLTGGLLDAGLSVVGAGALANAGSAQAISNVGTATAVAGAATDGLTASGPDAGTFNRQFALVERTSVLERTKVAKGC
ncbi:hypothetical protein ABLN87_20860 [Ruegeria sp. SCPT10]|uniref:hypothetical protein n=1 Tax=Ruegeria sp. SCP10 TaxID=3141377 RepID=UPI00333A612B